MEIVVPLFVIVAVGVSWVMASRRRRAWEQLARTHGLALGGGFSKPAIEGRYRDLPIRVSLENGSGNGGAFTTYRVTLGERVPTGLFVCKEGMLQKLGKAVGFQDITVGKPELDEALSIKGQDPVRIIRLLSIPEVGAAVLATIKAAPNLQIGQSLELAEDGFSDPKRLEHVLDMLCGLARVLETGCRALEQEDRPASA